MLLPSLPIHSDPETLKMLRSFLIEHAHSLSNLVMDLDYAIQEEKETDLEQVLRVLHAHSLQLVDLSLLLESQALSFYPTAVNVSETIRDIKQIMEARFQRMWRETTLPTVPALVRGDAERLFRVFYVVVDTAYSHAAYAPSGGWIDVQVEVQDTVSVTVTNNGPSVPAAILHQLGEPGVRLHPDLPREGWSLMYAQQVVAAHNGTISFAHAPSGGLQLRVDLPRLTPSRRHQ